MSDELDKSKKLWAGMDSQVAAMREGLLKFQSLTIAAYLAASTLQRVCEHTAIYGGHGFSTPLLFDCIEARDKLKAALADLAKPTEATAGQSPALPAGGEQTGN